ncbi:MAG: DUF3502 domain-containing protein [Lachnospiraceae bacterium]|nr:DUF3502 domain-containing protein [Lachnospiraceae bacterium]
MAGKNKCIVIGIFLIISVLALSACGNEKETIKLSWAVYEYPIPDGMEESFNKFLKEKGLPYEVDFYAIDPSDKYMEEFMKSGTADCKAYMEGCQEAVQKGEYDIVGFPAQVGYYDFYSIFARKGMLEPLDSYIEAGGSLHQIYPDKFWEVLRVNGEIYGLLNHWNNYKQYFVFNEGYLKKYGMELGEAITIEELKPLLQEVFEGENEAAGFGTGDVGRPFRFWGYEDTICSIISVDTTGETLVAKSNLEIPVFLERMEFWYELASYGIGAVSSNSYENGSFFVNQVYSYSKAAAVNEMYAGYGVDPEISLQAVECTEGDNPLCRWGYVTAISVNSKHKKESAELLGAIYSDAEFSNLLAYGVENENYRVIDGIAEPISDLFDASRRCYFGNNQITIPTAADSVQKRRELKEILDQIPVTKQAGFEFDCSMVEDEMKNVLQVYEKNYGLLIGEGESFEKALEICRTEFEKAGLSRIIEEMNRQLELFQAQ